MKNQENMASQKGKNNHPVSKLKKKKKTQHAIL